MKWLLPINTEATLESSRTQHVKVLTRWTALNKWGVVTRVTGRSQWWSSVDWRGCQRRRFTREWRRVVTSLVMWEPGEPQPHLWKRHRAMRTRAAAPPVHCREVPFTAKSRVWKKAGCGVTVQGSGWGCMHICLPRNQGSRRPNWKCAENESGDLGRRERSYCDMEIRNWKKTEKVNNLSQGVLWDKIIVAEF